MLLGNPRTCPGAAEGGRGGVGAVSKKIPQATLMCVDFMFQCLPRGRSEAAGRPVNSEQREARHENRARTGPSPVSEDPPLAPRPGGER